MTEEVHSSTSSQKGKGLTLKKLEESDEIIRRMYQKEGIFIIHCAICSKIKPSRFYWFCLPSDRPCNEGTLSLHPICFSCEEKIKKMKQREDIGHPKLQEHLLGIITLMKASANWLNFKRLVQRVFPKQGETLPLLLEDEREDANGD